MNGSSSVHAVFCAKKWKQGRNCRADAIFGKNTTIFGNRVVRDKNSCYFFHREKQGCISKCREGSKWKSGRSPWSMWRPAWWSGNIIFPMRSDNWLQGEFRGFGRHRNFYPGYQTEKRQTEHDHHRRRIFRFLNRRDRGMPGGCSSVLFLHRQGKVFPVRLHRGA